MNFSRSSFRAVCLSVLAIIAFCSVACGSMRVDRVVIDGQPLDKITIDGRPPDDYRAPIAIVPATDIAAGIVTLPNVPAFNWCYGCSATSAAMIMGYYDNTNFPNMYTGPANGGVCPMTNAVWGYGNSPLSATKQGLDGRNLPGHVEDYWRSSGNCSDDPYVGAWTEHTLGDCTGDYMGTNQSEYDNCDGATTFYFNPGGSPLYDYKGAEPEGRDGCHGLRLFVQSRGYTVTANFSQYIYGYNGNTSGFTFANFQSEIDQGRPVMIQVSGHTMVGYGYDSANQTIYIHDTWDHNNHSMTWGGSYSGMAHYGVTVLRITCSGPAPTISQHPTGGNRCVGQGISFSITASGATSYQWRKNGVNIAGATASTYTIASVTTTDAATYTCMASNACGSATSNGAILTVTPLPAITTNPTDKRILSGSTATFTVSATGSGLSYQWQLSTDDGVGYANIPGATTNSYTTPTATGGDDGNKYRCVVSGTCPPPAVSATATLNVDIGMTLLSEDFESPFVNGAPPGWSKAYDLTTEVADWTGATGDHTGGLAAEGTYNALLYENGNQDHKTYLITPELHFAGCATAATLEFWHKQSPTSRQDTLAICYKTSAAGAWNQIVIYTGNVSSWYRRKITLPNVTSTYYIGFLGNAKGGNGVCIDGVVVTQGCCPPSISSHPAPVAACKGTTASFAVTATGLGLQYQWRKDGAAIPGAVDSVLNIESVDASDVAGYDCMITNPCGSAVSSAAALTVTSPPVITAHPIEVQTWPGADATFAVSADGTGPISYQWRKNGAPISGAVGPYYTINDASPEDIAEYECVVSNACGYALSDAAVLNVVTPTATIAAAKLIPDGQPVALLNKPVIYTSAGFFYIEETDRSAGIRVQKANHGLIRGAMAKLVGAMSTNTDGERFISAAAAEGEGSLNDVRSLAITGAQLGGADWRREGFTAQRGVTGAIDLNNIGLLVKIWGSYTKTGETSFTLSDGSGAPIVCLVEPGFVLSPSWQGCVAIGVSSIFKVDDSTWRPRLLVRELTSY